MRALSSVALMVHQQENEHFKRKRWYALSKSDCVFVGDWPCGRMPPNISAVAIRVYVLSCLGTHLAISKTRWMAIFCTSRRVRGDAAIRRKALWFLLDFSRRVLAPQRLQ